MVQTRELDVTARPDGALRYILAGVITFALLCSLIPLSLLRLSRLGPTEHSSESARFIFSFSSKKQRIAERIQGNRIILVGGSGAFYSIRAKNLETKFGIPVVNNALHAGLGIEYLLRRARQSLHPGDTVLLFLEYAHFFRTKSEWTEADFYLPHDLDYFASRTLDEQIELVGKLTPREYGNRVYDAIFGKPVDGRQIYAALNERGDFIKNAKTSQSDFQRAALDNASAIRNMALKQESVRPISEFYQWCQRNGVLVIAGFPAFLDFSEYHNGRSLEFFHSLTSYYQSLGIPTLGDPEEFMFRKHLFFDTAYHMNDEGAEVMTDLVASRLGPILASMRRDPDSLRRNSSHADLTRFRAVRVVFSHDEMPLEIRSLSGFSDAESWGRWTVGDRAAIHFAEPLPVHFRLVAHVAHVFNENSKKPVLIRVGDKQSAILVKSPDSTISLDFQTDGKARTIEILPPSPQSPKQLALGADSRLLGVGFSSVEISALEAPPSGKFSR